MKNNSMKITVRFCNDKGEIYKRVGILEKVVIPVCDFMADEDKNQKEFDVQIEKFVKQWVAIPRLLFGDLAYTQWKDENEEHSSD